MEKFLTKENIIIIVVTAILIAQSNYFATKLDIANIKLEISHQKAELMEYSDKADKEILHDLDSKYQKILDKLDKKK